MFRTRASASCSLSDAVASNGGFPPRDDESSRLLPPDRADDSAAVDDMDPTVENGGRESEDSDKRLSNSPPGALSLLGALSASSLGDGGCENAPPLATAAASSGAAAIA
jgi:hypothetical protein